MAGKMVPAGHALPCGGINASISQMTPAESYMVVDVPLSSAASKRLDKSRPEALLKALPGRADHRDNFFVSVLASWNPFWIFNV